MSKRADKKATRLATAEHFLRQAEGASTASVSPLLVAQREKMAQLLRENGLPIYRDEAYQRFKINDALTEEWDLTSHPELTQAKAATYSCRLTYPDTHQAFIVGGQVGQSSHNNGFFAGSIKQFEQLYPEEAQRYYNQSKSIEQAPLTQLNSLFAEDLFVFYIQKSTKLQTPLHLIHYISAVGKEHTLTFPRILVIAEEGAEGTLLLCDHSSGESSAAYVGAIELFAGKGSKVHYYNIEESNKQTLRVMDTHITQEEDSVVVVDNITINNGRTRNNYFCALEGERASIDLDGLGILDDEMLLDNWAEIKHNSPNCHSDQLFKYTMNDRAVGSFSGLIYVAQVAQKTEAYQNNRNLLLSETAKMFSKPQLEIYADDVKCSHGMTTGELDDAAIFYMQQRGIPLLEAKLMLTSAFMHDVLSRIHYEPLRERLTKTIDNRFRGIPSTCR